MQTIQIRQQNVLVIVPTLVSSHRNQPTVKKRQREFAILRDDRIPTFYDRGKQTRDSGLTCDRVRGLNVCVHTPDDRTKSAEKADVGHFIDERSSVVVRGNPQHDRIGFRYWYEPGAFNTQYVDSNAGRFLAFWSAFTTAAFAIGDHDFIANCAPESINPRRNIPKAVRRVINRLIFFFILSVFAVGLLVPYNDPVMLTAIATGNGVANGVAKSPFVIAMNRQDIPFLPDLCNALVPQNYIRMELHNCSLFQASRTVFGLVKNGRGPKILAKTTKSGVPLPVLILPIAVLSLASMTCNTASAVVLNWFINLGSTAIMIAYILMMVANLRYHQGLKVQVIDVSVLPFKSRLTRVFTDGHWSFSGFFSAYFTIVFFVIIHVLWKVTKRAPFVKPENMNFQTGLAEVDLHERSLKYANSSSRYERFMNWIW